MEELGGERELGTTVYKTNKKKKKNFWKTKNGDGFGMASNIIG